MKLRNILLGLAVGLGTSLALVACGSSSSDTNTGGTGGSAGTAGSGGSAGSDNDAATDAPAEASSEAGGSGGGGDPKSDAGQPPGPPASNPPDGTADTIFAVNQLFLGATDRDGTPDPTDGWKHFGFNIDGYESTPSSVSLCKTVAGANPALVKQDGDNGIDNSFGENILPIILGLASDAEDKINGSILDGSFTIMVKAHDLGTAQNYTDVAAALYAGGKLGSTPKFDGTDQWPVLTELLNNGDINSPKVTFPHSYVTSRTWVSGSKGDVDLTLSISGYSLTLSIHEAVLAQDLKDDNSGGTNGTISGVLTTSELEGALQKVAGRISTSLCDGSTLQAILDQIAQASDIMQDGSQDTTKTCDGISIGLGFTTATAQLGAVLPASTGGDDPCATADAGTD